MRKLCFIVPYFGEMPNYFQLFLNSCASNENYNWLIFTDSTKKYSYPKNVKKIYMKFSTLKKLIQSKFDFPIKLTSPKKLCDYKPAFGYIFEDYIKGYDYWGHCDLDTIMGKLDDFIPQLLKKKYDKIFTLGHFILYKNNLENNRRFMKRYRGVYLFKKSFTTDNITVFDENYQNDTNVNSIFIDDNAKVYQGEFSFNVKVIPTRFIRIVYNNRLKKPITCQIPKEVLIVHTSEGLFELYIENNKLKGKEFMYIHLQQRLMRVHMSSQQGVYTFSIIPNGFYKLNAIPQDIFEFKKVRKRTLNIHRIRLTFKWKLLKLKNLIKTNIRRI